MRCKDCRYKMILLDGREKGICTFPESHVIINVNDPCLFAPESTEPKCGDCMNQREDPACFGCSPSESAIQDGQLCRNFSDKREAEFKAILASWKSRNLYSRDRIEKIIEEFEAEYRTLSNP